MKSEKIKEFFQKIKLMEFIIEVHFQMLEYKQ